MIRNLRQLPKPAVGLFIWGQVIEDWLDDLDVTVDDLITSMKDGWIFGYIDALAIAGTPTVLLLVSRTVDVPQRRTHAPSASVVWLFPPSRLLFVLRRLVDNPYATSVIEAGRTRSRVRKLLAAVAHCTLPWISTPFRQLRSIIRRENIDALIWQDYEDARFDTCILLRKVLRVSVFATRQSQVVQRTPLERLTRPHAIPRADGLIIGATREVERVRERYRIAPSKIHHVPNPVSVEAWPVLDRAAARRSLGIPTSAWVVSWHGRINIPQKGLDLLLDAWTQLTNAHPTRELVLYLTGSGPDSSTLSQELDRRQLRGVRWLNRFLLERSEIQQRLAAADVAVFPSRAEGFAVAALEMMASGRGLVATPVQGMEDVAPCGEAHGVLQVPSWEPGVLAAALSGLLEDPGRAETLGVAARRRIVTTFSLELVGPALAQAIGHEQGRTNAVVLAREE